jgi:hypothetical protein
MDIEQSRSDREEKRQQTLFDEGEETQFRAPPTARRQAMAGHAPEFLTRGQRMQRWIDDASDLGISIIMLGLAILTLGVIYAVDQRLLG